MRRHPHCRRCLAIGLVLSALLHALGLALWLRSPEIQEPPREREITLDVSLFSHEPAGARAGPESTSVIADGAGASSNAAADTPPTDQPEPLEHLARAEPKLDLTPEPEPEPEPVTLRGPEPRTAPRPEPMPESEPELDLTPERDRAPARQAEPESKPDPTPRPESTLKRVPEPALEAPSALPALSRSAPRQPSDLPPAPQIRSMDEIKAALKAARAKPTAEATRADRRRTPEVRQPAAARERVREEAKRQAAQEARRFELAKQEAGEARRRELAERKAAEVARRRERAEREAAEEARRVELARQKAEEARRRQRTEREATAAAGRSSGDPGRGSGDSTSSKSQVQGRASASRKAAEGAYLAELRRAIARHRRFPDDARGRRSTGTATLAFVVHADGRIREVRVAESSGDASLDQAALGALLRLDRFKPIPASIGRSRWRLKVPIHFDLR